MLENRVNKKDGTTLEYLRTIEENGIEMEVYNSLIQKDKGNVQDYFEIALPATLDGAVELLGEEKALQLLQARLLTDEQNRIRVQVLVSEKEKAEKIAKRREELKRNIELLKDLDADSLEEFKSALGL